MFRVYAVFCFNIVGCQYQCNRLPGKICLRNDLLGYVSSGSLNPTHSQSEGTKGYLLLITTPVD